MDFAAETLTIPTGKLIKDAQALIDAITNMTEFQLRTH